MGGCKAARLVQGHGEGVVQWGARRVCLDHLRRGTRRVQLVRRDGRDVSTLYGREGGGHEVRLLNA